MRLNDMSSLQYIAKTNERELYTEDVSGETVNQPWFIA